MRWFKHLTNAWDDEDLSAVTGEHGLELYGFWWRLLEIIGKQMDGSSRSHCKYSAKVWGKFSGISAKKFRKFADILMEKKLITLEIDEDDIFIDIPNLVNYRDEWTKKKIRDDQKTPE